MLEYESINIDSVRISSVRKFWAILGIIVFSLLLIYLFKHTTLFFTASTENFRIAQDRHWYSFKHRERASHATGFTSELLGAIASEEGIQISLFTPHAISFWVSLEEGEYDAILVNVASTQKNLEKYLLSDPIYFLGPVLVVRADRKIDDLKQMDNKILGIVAESFLSFNIDHYPALVLKTFETNQSALANLNQDAIDGVILDFLSAHIYTTGIYAGKLKVVTGPLNDSSLRLITKKTEAGKELIAFFNSGLQTARENGTYNKLIQKWGLFPQTW